MKMQRRFPPQRAGPRSSPNTGVIAPTAVGTTDEAASQCFPELAGAYGAWLPPLPLTLAGSCVPRITVLHNYEASGDYDDRIRRLALFTPPLIEVGAEVAAPSSAQHQGGGRGYACLAVRYDHKDQGWGNRKSMVYVGDRYVGEYVDGAVPDALSAEVADHTVSTVRSVVRLLPDVAAKWLGGANEAPVGIPFSTYIGGGGGHKLTLTNFAVEFVPHSIIPEMFHVLRQLREEYLYGERYDHDHHTWDAAVVSEVQQLMLNVSSIPDGPLVIALSFIGPLDSFKYLSRTMRTCGALSRE